MTRSVRWLAAPVALAAAALSLPAAASAATFCVHAPPGCVGTAQPTVSDAISAAGANGSGLDRIEIGPGTFAEPAIANAGNPVEVVGQGADATTLKNFHGSLLAVALRLEDPASRVSDIRLRVHSGASSEVALSLAGIAERVAVDAEAGTSGATGIALLGPAAVRDSTVSLPLTGNATGIFGSGAGARTVEDIEVTADNGMRFMQGTTLVRHARVRANKGIYGESSTLSVYDSLVEMGAAPSASGLEGGLNATVEAAHLTIVGSGGSGSMFAESSGLYLHASGAGSSSSMIVADSIVRGMELAIKRAATTGASGNVTIDTSSYDAAAVLSENSSSGTGSVTQGAGNVNLDPRYVDPGSRDFRLRFDSPLIDRGFAAPVFSPGEPDTDLDGLPRIVDGDGDGDARRDIGAFEYQRRAPAAAISGPSQALAGQPVVFDAGGSSDPDPGDALSYEWSFGDGGTATGPRASHIFAGGGPRTVTLTVRDPAGLTATGSMTVHVTEPPAPPPPGAAAACSQRARGTRRNNVLVGTPLGDRLLGLAGNDTLRGGRGDDCIDGGQGRDRVLGESGKDRLLGGLGADRLTGGRGRDRFDGGAGDDTMNSHDGVREAVRCGRGRDAVLADRRDRLISCERIRRR